jgi:BirA family transcriptional regulator, biotin operon repressor / biotin---[acetyl-CoA-carboxylase] ligase
MHSRRADDRATCAAAALAGTRFTFVTWVTETASTNTDLIAAARAGAPEGTVLVTDHQTAGRGTRGRTWTDEPGAQLMVSVLLRPDVSAPRLGRLTMAWGVAACDAAAEVCGLRLGLKWPNDVYDGAGSRKVAGVLAESVLSGPRVEAVVIGMGMNVNGGVPAGLAVPGVSLAELVAEQRGDAVEPPAAPGEGRLPSVSREDLLVALLRRLDTLVASDLEEVPELYRSASVTIGRDVRIEVPGGRVAASVVGVDDDGHLLVRLAEDGLGASSGDVVRLASGDVEHVRTA